MIFEIFKIVSEQKPFLLVLGVQDVQTLMMRGKNSSWCRACGYTASSNNDVIRHIEAKHLNLRLECKFCHCILRTRLNLQRHLKKRHPDKLGEPVGQRQNLNEIMAYHMEGLGFNFDTTY